MAVALLTPEELEAVVERAVRKVLAELQPAQATVVTFPEAARRLGVTVRAVQRWAKDGRLEVVPVGGLRMVRIPEGTGQG